MKFKVVAPSTRRELLGLPSVLLPIFLHEADLSADVLGGGAGEVVAKGRTGILYEV